MNVGQKNLRVSFVSSQENNVMCLLSNTNFAKLLRNCFKRQTGLIRTWKQNDGWASIILSENKHIHQDKILLLFKGTCHLKKKQTNPTKIMSLFNQGWTWYCSCLFLERKICEIIFINLLKRIEVLFRIIWYSWDNLHTVADVGNQSPGCYVTSVERWFLLFRKLQWC